MSNPNKPQDGGQKPSERIAADCKEYDWEAESVAKELTRSRGDAAIAQRVGELHVKLNATIRCLDEQHAAGRGEPMLGAPLRVGDFARPCSDGDAWHRVETVSDGGMWVKLSSGWRGDPALLERQPAPATPETGERTHFLDCALAVDHEGGCVHKGAVNERPLHPKTDQERHQAGEPWSKPATVEELRAAGAPECRECGVVGGGHRFECLARYKQKSGIAEPPPQVAGEPYTTHVLITLACERCKNSSTSVVTGTSGAGAVADHMCSYYRHHSRCVADPPSPVAGEPMDLPTPLDAEAEFIWIHINGTPAAEPSDALRAMVKLSNLVKQRDAALTENTKLRAQIERLAARRDDYQRALETEKRHATYLASELTSTNARASILTGEKDMLIAACAEANDRLGEANARVEALTKQIAAHEEICSGADDEPGEVDRLNPYKRGWIVDDTNRPTEPQARFLFGIRYYAGMLEDDDNPSHSLGHIEELCVEFDKAIHERMGKPYLPRDERLRADLQSWYDTAQDEKTRANEANARTEVLEKELREVVAESMKRSPIVDAALAWARYNEPEEGCADALIKACDDYRCETQSAASLGGSTGEAHRHLGTHRMVLCGKCSTENDARYYCELCYGTCPRHHAPAVTEPPVSPSEPATIAETVMSRAETKEPTK